MILWKMPIEFTKYSKNTYFVLHLFLCKSACISKIMFSLFAAYLSGIQQPTLIKFSWVAKIFLLQKSAPTMADQVITMLVQWAPISVGSIGKRFARAWPRYQPHKRTCFGYLYTCICICIICTDKYRASAQIQIQMPKCSREQVITHNKKPLFSAATGAWAHVLQH